MVFTGQVVSIATASACCASL